MNHHDGVTHADHHAHQHHVLAELCLLALPTPGTLLRHADRAAIAEMNRYLLARQRARWDTAALCVLALPVNIARPGRPKVWACHVAPGWLLNTGFVRECLAQQRRARIAYAALALTLAAATLREMMR